MSLFNIQGVDPNENDRAVLALEAFKVALHEAQITGLHTYKAQGKVDKAFETLLLAQTEKSYQAGWEAAMQLKGGDS